MAEWLHRCDRGDEYWRASDNYFTFIDRDGSGYILRNYLKHTNSDWEIGPFDSLEAAQAAYLIMRGA